MRRLIALSFLLSSLACGCAAGLAAPAALATGSQGVTVSTNALTSPSSNTPGFGITSGGAATTPQIQTTPAPVTSTSSSSGGLSALDGVIIAVVVALVLGGIALWIWYDARGHTARVGHGRGDDALFGQRAHAGSKAPHRQRKLTPAERKRRKRGRAR
ncbi:MAG TPA: hypothetical protein VG228_04115 [Solirubrobacteraceae bacterium]|jgi:hypothetical protein|nr:hypothetical protein [Solirubrobacteraceae bacterium]